MQAKSVMNMPLFGELLLLCCLDDIVTASSALVFMHCCCTQQQLTLLPWYSASFTANYLTVTTSLVCAFHLRSHGPP